MADIRNLVAGFDDFAAQGPGDDLVDRWHREVVAPDSGIFSAITPWVDATAAWSRLPGLVARRAEVTSRVERAGAAVRRAETLLTDALGELDRPVRVVLLVGLGQANGWVAPVDGEPTLFLGVEQLPDPPYDVVLALHELVHLVHRRRNTYDWPTDRVDADLFREGLAVYATSRLLPSIPPSGHLWFRADERAWIARCAAQEPELRRRALRELDRTDVSALWFGGAADRAGDLPGRCGYWLGWRLLGRLVEAEPLVALLDRSPTEAAARLRVALAATDAAGSGPATPS